MLYTSGGQIAARGPNGARHSVFSGPRKHSQKSSNLNILQLYTANVSAEANLNRDLFLFPEDLALR